MYGKRKHLEGWGLGQQGRQRASPVQAEVRARPMAVVEKGVLPLSIVHMINTVRVCSRGDLFPRPGLPPGNGAGPEALSKGIGPAAGEAAHDHVASPQLLPSPSGEPRWARERATNEKDPDPPHC